MLPIVRAVVSVWLRTEAELRAKFCLPLSPYRQKFDLVEMWTADKKEIAARQNLHQYDFKTLVKHTGLAYLCNLRRFVKKVRF